MSPSPQRRWRSAPTPPLIALTPTEYNNTIRELLSLPEDGNKWPELPAAIEALVPNRQMGAGTFGSAAPYVPPWPWPLSAESGIDGFEGMAKGQAASAYQVEQLQKAALTHAAYTLVSPVFHACSAAERKGASEDKLQECAGRSVRRFAQRAYRRPMSAAEVGRLDALFAANVADSTLDEAIVLTVAGILQAPAFLYRLEAGMCAMR